MSGAGARETMAGAPGGEAPSPVAVSVAIATLGRAEKLERVLAALAELAPGSPPFEAVVVVDGEDAASAETLARPRPFDLRAVVQPHAGAGPARNRAAAEARGELLLFLNDDTRPRPECLIAHAAAQRRHGPCLGAGLVEWDPDAETTEYMRWLAPAGHQYNFARLTPGAPVPWDAVWATNLSAPRAWVLDEPFAAGWPGCLEDSEWAYRQYRRGRRGVFVHEAVALHDHHYAGPADYRARARCFGIAARTMVARHPALALRFTLRPLAAAAARVATLALPSRRRRHLLWDLDFRVNYLLGLLHAR